MEFMVAAYLLGWAATSAYVGWLAVQNARLISRQQELTTMLEQRNQARGFYSTAA